MQRGKRIKDIILKLLLCVVFLGVIGFIFYDFFLKPKPESYSLPDSLITTSATIPLSDTSMIGLLNEIRTMNNLPLFREDERLDRTAKRKACDMQDKGYFEHVDPAGAFAWYMYHEEGYEYTEAGENLVENTAKPIEDIFYLMASPEHRKNILYPGYKDVGIGMCGIYLVQHFGSQAEQ